MSSGPTWTPKQFAAITRADGALLVSAAAGSGKTAVLAARCVHLVCTADVPCDIDQLLVLTFTRAAAGEMRERIERELRKHVEKHDEPRLQRQLRLIDRATITTLDGFCASLIRANFHLLGIDPGFAILAPEDAILLKHEVVERLLDAEYESPGAEPLKAFLDSYFGADDSRLRAFLLETHAMLQSVVDPEEWHIKAIRRLVGGADGTDKELLSRFADMQRRALRSTHHKLISARRIALTDVTLDAYVKQIDLLLAEIDDWIALSEAGSFDPLSARALAFTLPRLPTVKQAPPELKEKAQTLIDSAKADLKGKGETLSLCRWGLQQLRADLATIAPHAEYFLGLTNRFSQAYDRAKTDLRTLDFADTERMAFTLLRQSDEGLLPSLSALDIQQKFHHVLVDEYQDINPLQNAILRLASRDISAESDPQVRSNFFAVGDVKQSIYRFRLADPQQFIDRQAILRAETSLGEVIDLQENFRSRGPLLDAVNDVFRLLMTGDSAGIDYDVTHELRSILPYPDLGPLAFTGKPIELHFLPRDIERADGDSDDDEQADSFEREISLVAYRIRRLIDERRPVGTKQDGARPIRYGDIAVLLRSAKFKASVVADELRVRGIPVHADDTTGFFNNTEVQDILAILKLIANGQQDIPMAAFLRSPIANIADPEDALATIRLLLPNEPFHRAVTTYAHARKDPLGKQLSGLLGQLTNWRERFHEQPIGESLSQLFDETGYLTFCRALPDGAQRVANLQELRERAIAFDSFERQGLDRFLAFLEEMEADDQLGRPSIAAGSQDCVRVMTVHKSKGLEFPVVIVPDLGKQFNEQSLKSSVLIDRDFGLGFAAVDLPNRVRYPSVASMVIKDHARRQLIAEEVRVLYVALTRAREHLILIGTSRSPYASFVEDWANHGGPLPDAHTQRARTALDWIAPIAAITERQGLGTFTVQDWSDQSLPDSDADARELSAAKLLANWYAASDKSVDLPDAAKHAIERVTFAYAHSEAARTPATKRVTDLEASPIAAPVTAPVTSAVTAIAAPHPAMLEWPASYKPRDRAGALEIGTATHRFLELIDPARLSAEADIAPQIQELIARRLLSEKEAKLIDLPAIAWLIETDLGHQLRDPRNRVFREQSLAYSIQPPGLGVADCVLVRGRLDLMLVTPSGLILADYKTDRVDADGAIVRAESYWPQLRGYAEAVSRVAKLPVIRACLVFLRARRIIDLPADSLATYGGR